MRRGKILTAIAATSLLALAPSVSSTTAASSISRACGKIDGVPIHTHKISCKTTYRTLSAEGVVLGGAVYGGEHGEGWGTAHPKTIYNGGDPSGLISNVHWSSWGGAVARGHGRNSIFKPHGGYYRHQVTIQLKTKRIGRCEGRRAYLKLFVREPRKPGGPLGPWLSWSGQRTICEPYA